MAAPPILFLLLALVSAFSRTATQTECLQNQNLAYISTIHSMMKLSTTRFHGRYLSKYRSELKHLDLYLLLILSGQIELNPGPTADSTTYPCGICQENVNWGQRAICCDKCDLWHHASCMNMNEAVYNVLEIAHHSQ